MCSHVLHGVSVPFGEFDMELFSVQKTAVILVTSFSPTTLIILDV